MRTPVEAKVVYGTSAWQEEEIHSLRASAIVAADILTILSGKRRPQREFAVDEQNPKAKVIIGEYWVEVIYLSGN